MAVTAVIGRSSQQCKELRKASPNKRLQILVGAIANRALFKGLNKNFGSSSKYELNLADKVVNVAKSVCTKKELSAAKQLFIKKLLNWNPREHSEDENKNQLARIRGSIPKRSLSKQSKLLRAKKREIQESLMRGEFRLKHALEAMPKSVFAGFETRRIKHPTKDEYVTVRCSDRSSLAESVGVEELRQALKVDRDFLSCYRDIQDIIESTVKDHGMPRVFCQAVRAIFDVFIKTAPSKEEATTIAQHKEAFEAKILGASESKGY